MAVRECAGAAALVLALASSACDFRGLNFVEDTRVRIMAPADHASVTLPVTLRWAVSDFEITGPSGDVRRDGGYFGVFVDRSPQPPGKPLTWLARNEETCMPSRGCPDDEWLSERGVHTTTALSLTLDSVPRRTDDERELHEVVLVLLDASGRRIGESAFAVQFRVVRSR